MPTQAKATFELKSWDEKPFSEVEGAGKLSHAVVRKTFHGDVEGDGALEYLMAYHTDGTATFTGLERIIGKLAGKQGSFVLRHDGTFEAGVAKTKWEVVPGSATGELKGLRGEGGFASSHAQQYPMTLDYWFE